MNYDVVISFERQRRCGYRTSARDGVGKYLVSEGLGEPCERLPMPLDVCPCCGAGVKFSRSWTWVQPLGLFPHDKDPVCQYFNPLFMDHKHGRCVMCTPELAGEQVGLLWIGQKHYTVEQFEAEASAMGVSRKIHSIPRGFKVGYHYVYLAHLKAVRDWSGELGDEPELTPGVFRVFLPTRVDLVIDDPQNIPDTAKRLKDRLGDGAQLVKVIPDKRNLFDELPDD